ncbi:MAG: TIGR02996 domain-containing protein [Myxococcaceae bacterium]
MVDVLEADLLAAVHANPGDDGPRLVFADYLMERQDPRGDFIRLQVEGHAHLPGRRKAELERRAAMLLLQHRVAWSPFGLEWRFVRGFPASVKLSASAVFEFAARLMSVPTFEGLELNFHGMTDSMALAWIKRLEQPVFRRLRSLRLTWYVPQAVPRALVESSWVEQLDALQLSWVTLDDVSWKTLANATTLHGLRTLDLGLSGSNDAAFEGLCGSPWPKLETLRLANNQQGTRTCELVVDAARFPALTTLDLSWNRVGKKGGAVLTTSPLIQRLVTLDLAHTQIADDFVKAIIAAKPARLVWLGLEQTRITDEAIKELQRAAPNVLLRL